MQSDGAPNVYLDYLKREGYVPALSEAGMITFKREGLTYAIPASGTDPVFFQMLLPNIYRAVDDASRREVLAVCNMVTSRTKVAKVVLAEDGWVTASAELFCQSADEVTKVFPRCFSALQTAMRTFADAVNGA